jgi:uncharacterized membrane protein YphA (DoxX/SURF4 family)
MKTKILAILRILVGLLLVDIAVKKWIDPNFFHTEGFIAELVRHGRAYPFYQSLLVSYVFPHAKMFAILAALGESVVGLSLLLGAFTNPLSIIGVFMILNFCLATSYGRPGNLIGHMVFIGLVGLFGACSAGRTWGADLFFARVMSPRLVFFPYHRRHLKTAIEDDGSRIETSPPSP